MAAAKPDMASRYDFVIFGATGFTGQYCVEEMIRTVEKNNHLTWAVAGRNESKLKEVLEKSYKLANKECPGIPIIIADVSNEASLGEMCRKAKIVLNCAGPYRFYGEAVVKACIENKTHHVDISGEPQFLEKMQLNYNELARNNGVYIVGACGYDSIPCEAGLKFLRDKFPGDLTYAETYIQFHTGPHGGRVNFGTYQSAIYGVAHASELKALRKKLFPERLPKSKYAPPTKKLFHSDEVNGWCVPFLGSDKSVVTRSNHYLYTEEKMRPYSLNTYLRVGPLYATLILILMGMIFAVFSMFSFGRKLLEAYPKVFSLGLFSKEGPTREQVKEGSFTMTHVGYGYEDKLESLTNDHATPPDTKLVVKLKGPEAGYIATPICLIQSALILLQEKDKLPAEGGVYPAGAAFEKTTLIDRLSKNGFDFVSGNPTKI